MLGLYDRDYTKLTVEETNEKERIDAECGCFSGATFHQNQFGKYSKAMRHYVTLFPNNYMDIAMLKKTEELKKQCDEFENLLEDKNITELDIKRFIQDNSYYHIPASIFDWYNFGHHEAALFKEFQLGTSYRADYLLVGHSSGGWEFIFVEFEKPYGGITLKSGDFGETIRKGLNQIYDWKTFIESNYATISTEFEKYVNPSESLPKEFTKYDSTRMHYVVIAGRRRDFSVKAYSLKRRTERDQNIKIMHYDNLLDSARELIGRNTY